jgi:hypothetical protein
MKPTIDYIQRRFDEYNTRFFGGQLPSLPVRLSHAKGFLGKITFTRRRKGLFAGYRNEDFVLRINVRIDLPEQVVEDTILHEMIHYYIAVNQWNDTSTHGRLFRQEMARINKEGNRHITVTHKLSESEQEQTVLTKGRVVAVVRFTDGRTGIKVVPKQVRHILDWNRRARKTFDIVSIDWYYTNNGYFAKYPSSVALRIFLTDDLLPANDSRSPLFLAHRLSISDNSVRLTVTPGYNLRW